MTEPMRRRLAGGREVRISHVTADDLRRLPYDLYLRTDHWAAVRERALDDRGHKCQFCSSTEFLEVHHGAYDTLGREPLSDLLVLCRDCHALMHRALDEKRRRARAAAEGPGDDDIPF